MRSVVVARSLLGVPLLMLIMGGAALGATQAGSRVPPPDAAAPIRPATAAQHARIGGTDVAYHVSWAETVLKDAAGVAQATISATTYLRDGVGDTSSRPVIFAFNGGPGASSSPLHFSLLGPRRWIAGPGGARTVGDNEESLLDVADLVLLDPVGTGFSRELQPGGGKAYWSPAGDAKAAETVIRAWLRDQQRTSSPIYIVGESYGGFRVAQMSRDIADLNIAGIVLISPATDLSGGLGSDQQHIFDLPTMAVTAVQHGKVAAGGRSAEQVWEEARVFAQGEYAVALQLGSALPDAERNRLSERMSKLTGLPPAAIVAANLRVGTQDFLEQLLPGRVVGRLDTRVSAPRPERELVPGRSKVADDPALGLGASNVIKSAALRDYLRQEVGVQTERDYVSLSLDVNFAWNWNSGSPRLERNTGHDATPHLATLMSRRPSVRLLVLGGYYDLATPLLAPRYALTHVRVPLDRTEFVALPQGHTVSESDAGRREVSAMLHRFVSGRAASGSASTRF